MPDVDPPLRCADLDPDPVRQFARWRELAGARDDVIALATATADGRPSVRMVLLRGTPANPLRFFTGYDSRKAKELAENPRAAFAWYDEVTGRQVRVEGRVEQVPAQESDAYWLERPLGSRLSAWASRQSAPVPDRETMDGVRREAAERFPDGNVPRPERWGGYRLEPDRFEFWQRRADRFHDRFEFVHEADGWRVTRLWP